MAFSDVCYQWGANTSLLMSAAPLGQGGWGSLSENLKGIARVIYMIGVSTFIAPVGLTYHLFHSGLQKGHSLIAADPVQANDLSQLAWWHLRCSEKDFFSFVRGCFISAVALTCLGIVTVSRLYKGIKENNLMITVTGGLTGFIAYLLIFDQTHARGSSLVYQAWDNLAVVSHSLNHNHLDSDDLIVLAITIAIEIFNSYR